MKNSDTQKHPKTSEGKSTDKPTSRYVGTFWAALAISALLLTGFEFHLRQTDGAPNLENTPDRWSRVRANVEADSDPNSIVLLGASRMQSNVSLNLLSEEASGANVYQLAEAGRLPYAGFEDIAQRSEFQGLVIVSVVPGFLMPGAARFDQKELVDYYHAIWNVARHTDTWLSNQVASTFMFRDPDFKIINLLRNYLKTGSIKVEPRVVNTDQNREQTTFFENVGDLERMRTRQIKRVKDWLAAIDDVSPQDWVKILQTDVSELVTRIEKRGGRVAFVYMPVSDDLLKIDEDVFPRADYWDQIAEHTGADTIHFSDYPSLSGFDLPDASHMDHKDKDAFTRGLTDVLRSLGHLS